MEITIPATKDAPYSNKAIYDLIENFLRGRQTKNMHRIVEMCHPSLEYRGESPEKAIHGIELFKYRMQEVFDQTLSFHFKLLRVLWDDTLSIGTAIIEYEFVHAETKKSERVYEIAVFKITNNLLSYYVSSKTVLRRW